MRELRNSSVIFVAAALIVLPLCASAAELYFSPGSGTFAAGDSFSIKVSVDPKGENVNAADGVVTFDPALASVTSVSKDGSAFSLWTADPTFSNTEGTVTFSGGTPTAFAGKSTVATIKFKAKAQGSLKMGFKSGSVLAADGKGTNVYTAGVESLYEIGAAAPKVETKAEETPSGGFLAGGDPPIAPSISSPTHPKSDAWYGTSTVQFTWKPPADAVTIRTILSQKETDTPTEVQKNATDPLTITGIADGVWHLIAQYKNEFGWGESGVFKVQIDTTPPKEFEVNFIEGADKKTPSRFTFTAEDELSGVDRYQILYGETVAATVRTQDLVDGGVSAPPTDGGAIKVTIKAFDKAGNARDVAKEFTLPLIVKPSGKGAEEEEKESPWNSERILTIIFAFVIGALSAIMVYTRNQAAREKERLIDRISAMSDKFDRIFASMREEFEQMVEDFDEKPQLTPAEREMLEHIKEVIDISEELVDTDMGELKRSVRGQ
jgi:hypothetical protein